MQPTQKIFYAISIHPPRAEGLIRPIQRRSFSYFNHPPVREGHRETLTSTCRYFNPPPRAGRDPLRIDVTPAIIFQSTLPVREGTIRGFAAALEFHFNPPSRAEDFVKALYSTSDKSFQSTPPLRGGT
jgi:hypothetical protein